MGRENFDIIVNLAAQAGVRFSIEQPYKYLQSNLEGFLNILEGCRFHPVKHLVFASSSSVYGTNTKVPFSTTDMVDHPISLYAATKKSNELMGHAYSHLYNIPTTGLRFFTVYGPWGRPDMAYYKFTKAILNNRPIDVYNNGDMYRDFTYIDDIIFGISNLLDKPPMKKLNPEDGLNIACTPYKIYNIGNSKPESLKDFIDFIEEATGKKAIKNMKEMQPGDVYKTYADVSDLEEAIGYKPTKSLKEGISKFVEWYREWHNQ
jgi:UDP-glucuronate 4-epimerase